MQRMVCFTLVSAVFWSVSGIAESARAQCTLPYQLTNADLSDAMKLTANFKAIGNCISARNPTNSIQINGGNGALAGIGPLTDAQLLIGSTGNAPRAQTLASTPGIAITNSGSAITIAAMTLPPTFIQS